MRILSRNKTFEKSWCTNYQIHFGRCIWNMGCCFWIAKSEDLLKYWQGKLHFESKKSLLRLLWKIKCSLEKVNYQRVYKLAFGTNIRISRISLYFYPHCVLLKYYFMNYLHFLTKKMQVWKRMELTIRMLTPLSGGCICEVLGPWVFWTAKKERKILIFPNDIQNFIENHFYPSQLWMNRGAIWKPSIEGWIIICSKYMIAIPFETLSF